VCPMLAIAPSGEPVATESAVGWFTESAELPSSSGLGLRPFKAAARVRIPLGARLDQ
jgi:hypothetical protein